MNPVEADQVVATDRANVPPPEPVALPALLTVEQMLLERASSCVRIGGARFTSLERPGVPATITLEKQAA